MALEIQTYDLKANQDHTFTFNNPVTQYMVGMSAFSLGYGPSTDHHVVKAAIQLQHNMTKNQVMVSPTLTLFDDGHQGNAESDRVTVVVLAWTGVSAEALTLANQYGIPNQGSGPPIPITANSPNTNYGLLSGFDFVYSSSHHVREMSANVGTVSPVSGALNTTLTGAAQMSDGSGHTASTAHVDGGLIVSADNTLDIALVPTGTLYNNGAPLSLGQYASYKHFQPLLTGFRVQFPSNDDHHLQEVTAGIMVKIVGSNLAVAVGVAHLHDDSSNYEDDSQSYARGFILCYN